MNRDYVFELLPAFAHRPWGGHNPRTGGRGRPRQLHLEQALGATASASAWASASASPAGATVVTLHQDLP